VGHFGGVQISNLLELALVRVAAILGEKQWETIVGEVLHLLIPTGGGERGRVTIGIVVEGEEVATLIVSTTVHVLGHLKAIGVDVGLEDCQSTF
jgi:hypothetical protein